MGQLIAVGRALALFASCIKSGEPWSPECEAAMGAARAELDSLAGPAAPETDMPFDRAVDALWAMGRCCQVQGRLVCLRREGHSGDCDWLDDEKVVGKGTLGEMLLELHDKALHKGSARSLAALLAAQHGELYALDSLLRRRSG